MATQTERANALKSLAAFRKQLPSAGFEGDVTDPIEVSKYINDNPDKFEKGTAEKHAKAVKALSAEISPDGMQALVSWSEGEASMEEEAPEEEAAPVKQLAQAVQEIRKVRNELDTLKSASKTSAQISVKLPGERTWEVLKSRGQTVFKTAEAADYFGNAVLSTINSTKTAEKNTRAEYARKQLNERYGHGQKVQGTSPLAYGGSTIAQQLQSEVLATYDEFGIASRYLRNVSMPKGSLEWIEDTDGVDFEFVGEGATSTETNQTWANVEMRAKKAMAKTYINSELIQDSAIAVAEYIARRFVDRIAYKEDICLFLGDGTAGTYGGINGLAATFSAKASNYRNVTGASATTSHTIDHIHELMGKMPARYRKGAAFHCHSAVTAQLFDRLAANVGGVQMAEIQGYGFVKTFLGVPIVENYVMNSDTALSGDVVDVYYANLFEAGVFGDCRSLDIKTSDIPRMEYDQTVVVGTRRFDINLWNLGARTSQSPVVALWQD